MMYLLKLEWMKVKRYRTFWILFALFIVSMLGINYVYWEIKQQLVSSADLMAKTAGSVIFGDFNFPGVFKTVTQISSWMLYFPGFIIIFHTTNEFIYKTHRQNIIDGLSRKQFVVSKLLVCFALAICCTLIITLTSFLFGWVTGEGTITAEGLAYLGYFFIQSCIYILFAFLLALLIRKAALAVGIFFIFGLIFDSMLAGWISKTTGNALGFYLMPLQVADELNPPIEQVRKAANISTDKNIALVICLAWIGFYTFFPIWKFEREDL
jgi:ABC-type transport system involved in multi-copper enzyme maturation permease subunit